MPKNTPRVEPEEAGMSRLVIEVTPELEQVLREQADERGLTIAEFVPQALEALTMSIVRDPER
jgi:hypothetical protein